MAKLKEDQIKFFEYETSKNKVEKFNSVYKNLISKDVDLLEKRINKIRKEMVKRIVIFDSTYNDDKEYTIKDIKDIIEDTENLISNYIIEKENIRIGAFTRNKKQKRERASELERLVNYLFDCQNNFISIKNEYSKLKKRKIKESDIEDEEIVEKSSDPLERTINFYIKKSKKEEEND